MPVPDYQTLMRPTLAALRGGSERSAQELRALIAAQFSLTPEDLAETIPSKYATLFNNRIGWAITYLYQAKVIDRPKPATYSITERGLQVLDENPDYVGIAVLSQFAEFREFKKRKAKPLDGGSEAGDGVDDHGTTKTPEEQMEAAAGELEAALASELIERIVERPPEFLEKLVLDLLLAMGYGAGATHLGKTGDGGVDGVLREDRLGLDSIYVQAKRYAVDKGIGPEDIQKFVGALAGKNATRGIFITTSYFTSGAKEYADSQHVVLIDGSQLADLMVENSVGVRTIQSFAVKRVDLDFFVSAELEAG